MTRQVTLNTSAFPRIVVREVLVDMDWTITHEIAPPARAFLRGLPPDQYCLALLRDLVAQKRHLSDADSLHVICDVCDPDRHCLFSALPGLNIEQVEFWQVMLNYHMEHMVAYPDAVRMIKTLHKRGLKLYTATSNSRMTSLSKLTVAKLADMDGSPYFCGFFGGDICEKGKTGPQFFRAILAQGRFDSDDVLMIGDDPQNDLAYARSAGINHVILIRRTQCQPFVRADDGGWYVNSLDLVSDMIDYERL